ncbi:hypothetical protein ABZ816_16660 [Actinosynnema sp. NPDC047251]|uniref:Uncharacterized protein n=1 Tax=Saccharothrix espanaensis (strain ATCC 51144 / DSM 44229 / JCM 9112 / NBRC 15066 / NRRL 15764) TaxID=1179773 RepID=K0JYW7_SACES|nr:hypothetical protein [Saccharothrix espanaensis]CCH30472.1 hypothetical protein BN6_31670 [Saccharothrix espanaensis DSM 44229]
MGELLVVVIVACEIGFWAVLGAGLFARYVLRMPKLGAVLLVCTPLVDVVLLVATVFDLRSGGEAKTAHGLAAIYLGVSIAFGHSMLRWADQRFAHRFAGGPPPVKPPKHGVERVRHEWREWFKFLLAWAVAGAVVLLLTFVVSTPERTEVLWGQMRGMSVVGLIWLVGWPVFYSAKEATAKVAGRGE